MKSSKKEVCAAIVTFNRKFLLERCISNILSQIYPISRIIVVDNNSTDGSQQYIEDKLGSALSKNNINLVWIRLNQNVGGAGGFNKAVEEYLRGKEDFLWLMDDDGFPNASTLTKLLEYANDNCYIGPLVLSDSDKNTLTFPLRLPGSLKTLDTLDDISNDSDVINGIVLPFNGTLISKSVVEKIGLPKKEYFIWGDEVDYTERARKAQASIFTVKSALFYHPKARNVGNPMFFGKLRFNDPDSDLKLYCYCRNNFVNQKKYKGTLRAFLFVGKATWYYSFTRPSLRRLKVSLKAFADGLIGDFSKHKDYL